HKGVFQFVLKDRVLYIGRQRDVKLLTVGRPIVANSPQDAAEVPTEPRLIQDPIEIRLELKVVFLGCGADLASAGVAQRFDPADQFRVRCATIRSCQNRGQLEENAEHQGPATPPAPSSMPCGRPAPPCSARQNAAQHFRSSDNEYYVNYY